MAITLIDAMFYWFVLSMAILFLFSVPTNAITFQDREVILGTTAAYALPYWLSLSQPRYHFPVVPLLTVFAAAFAESLLRQTPSEVFRPVIASRRRRLALLLTLAFFAYIQLEWAYVAYFAGFSGHPSP